MSETFHVYIPDQTPQMTRPPTYEESYRISKYHAEQLRILIDQPASVDSPEQQRRQLRDFGDGALLGAERRQAMNDASSFRRTLYRDVRGGIEDIFADPIYNECDEDVRCDDSTRHYPVGAKSIELNKRCIGCRDDAVVCTFHTLSRHSWERPASSISSGTVKEVMEIHDRVEKSDSPKDGKDEDMRCAHSTRRHSADAKSINLERYCNNCRNDEVVCADDLLSRQAKLEMHNRLAPRKTSQGVKREHCEAPPIAKRRNLAGSYDIGSADRLKPIKTEACSRNQLTTSEP